MMVFIRKTWLIYFLLLIPVAPAATPPDQIVLIHEAIQHVSPGNASWELAETIFKHSQANRIDPLLMIALIKVESEFRQDAVSSSGDISIVQINYPVWKKEFARHGIDLDRQRLKTDSNYAIGKMAKILKILKTKYKSQDPAWYGRYHSKTQKYKLLYLKKVHRELKKVKTVFSASI